jgi:translation elongation factor EF-1alpha
MELSKEQKLLVKLYECQEIICEINKTDKNIKDYSVLSEIISSLEKQVITNSGAII